jgi:hypothetical protein
MRHHRQTLIIHLWADLELPSLQFQYGLLCLSFISHNFHVYFPEAMSHRDYGCW